MTLGRAADFASLYVNDLPEATLRCWKGNGITRVIIGAHRPARLPLMLTRLEKFEIEAELYIYWPLDQDPTPRIKEVTGLFPNFNIGTVWLDEEDPDGYHGHLTTTDVIDHIQKSLYLLGDHDRGIYTAAWWWQGVMNLGSAFKNEKLWDARYVAKRYRNPVFDQQRGWEAPRVPFLPYGGWHEATMTQWHDTTDLCGVDVDISDYNLEERMRYTDEALDNIVAAAAQGIADGREGLAISKSLASAFFDHVQHHPGGGPLADTDELAQAVANIEDIERRMEASAAALKKAA